MAASQFGAARTEFKDLSIPELQAYEKLFKQFDVDGDGSLDLQELKALMESLDKAQTHLALKAMIKEVDEDNSGDISYREFLLIYRYAKQGKLQSEGLKDLAGKTSISVAETGVGGAAAFFTAKANEGQQDAEVAAKDAAFRAERRAAAAKKAENKKAFAARAAMFQ